MKGLILFLAILIALYSNTYSQWELKSNGTDKFLSGVHFISENVAYVNGDHGLVFKTTDSGENWNEIFTGYDEYLRSIFFVTEQMGWVVGSTGIILKTTNGGTSWEVQVSPSVESLRSVFFIDSNNGWIAGYNGTILHTSDGGSTWVLQSSTTTKHLKSIFFVSIDSGYAVGFEGVIVRTTNGGNNWEILNSGITTTLNSVRFDSYNAGWAVGSLGKILYTNDGGNNWEIQDSHTENNCSAIAVINGNKVYVVGSNGLILKTTDSGINWNSENSNTINRLYGISNNFYGKILCVGELGTILLGNYEELTLKITSPNKNDIWEEGSIQTITWESENIDSINIKLLFIEDGPSEHIIAESIKNDNSYTFYVPRLIDFSAEGELRIEDNHSTISASISNIHINLIRNWENKSKGMTNIIRDIHFFDDNSGFILGSLNYKTTNAGRTWVYDSSIPIGNKIYFFNSNIGWIFGNFIYHTEDGGENWEQQEINYSGSIVSMSFTTQLNGWIVGKNKIWKTTDGGKSWQTIEVAHEYPNHYYKTIFFKNDNIGWIGGGYKREDNNLASTYQMLKMTEDGGVNWESIYVGTVSSEGFKEDYYPTEVKRIHFYDRLNGYIVTNHVFGIGFVNNDGLYHTLNGGETFVKVNTGLNSRIYDIEFIDTQEIWAIGGRYSYHSGGVWPVIVHTSEGDNGFSVTNDISLTSYWSGLWTKLCLSSPFHVWAIGTGVYNHEYIEENFILEYDKSEEKLLNWKIAISISDSINSKSLFFGEAGIATNEIDPTLNETELPPSPPIGIFDARLILPDKLTSTDIDFRNSSETEIIWDLNFQPSSSGYPISFTWKSYLLPHGSFYLRDAITGSIVNIDMKIYDNYSLTIESINHLQIVHKEEHQSTILNNRDWNLISIPLLTDNMEISSLLPDAISSAFIFDGTYKSKMTFANGVGYWIKFESSNKRNIYGEEVSEPIIVDEGWNLIGSYYQDINLNQLGTIPNGIITNNVYGFDNGYYIANKLEVGKGYWVKANQSGEINIIDSTAFGKKVNRLVLNSEPSISFVIAANDGVSDSIYLTFGLDSNATDGYDLLLGEEDLPPLPPLGVFDIRIQLPDTLITTYSDIRFLAVDCYEHIINYQLGDSSKGLTLYWDLPEGVNLNLSDMFGGNIFNENFEAGKDSFAIVNTGITNAKLTFCYNDIVVSQNKINLIPGEFSLSQNYPNPFNPSTKIKFGLPTESKVSLVIYNILGEQVTQLVNQQLKAGYHEVEFNIARHSSGIYFYRLHAGDFVETKKMVLLK